MVEQKAVQRAVQSAGWMAQRLVDSLAVQMVVPWAAGMVVRMEVYSAMSRADCSVVQSVDQKDDCWAATMAANLVEHSGLLMVARSVAHWAAPTAAM